MAGRFFDIPAHGAATKRSSPLTSRVALLVGNAAYSGGRLRNTVADVELIARRLRQLDFDVELLIDTSKATLETAIVEFSARLQAAGPEAVALFYFAGHGIQFEGHNFLIPVDATIPDIRYLRSAAVRADRVVEELGSVETRANVIILDACRNNPVPGMTAASRDALRGLASVRNIPDATLVVFSTAAGDIADDGEGSNGPYAVALDRRLSASGRQLHEVFFDVSADVTAGSKGAQRPALFFQGALPPIVLNSGEPERGDFSQTPPLVAAASAPSSTHPGLRRRLATLPARLRNRVAAAFPPAQRRARALSVAGIGALSIASWLVATKLLWPHQLTLAEIATATSPLTWARDGPSAPGGKPDRFGLTADDWARAPQVETVNKVIATGLWPEVERGVQQGDAKSATLAAAHLSGVDPSWGVRDEVTMARLAARAAETGLPAALTLRAFALRLGLGVPADPDGAETLFRKAADAGSALAAYQLGEMLLSRDGGRRAVEAEPWLLKADAGGMTALAALQLGLLNAGDIDRSRPPNYPQAETWLRKAASAGQAAAAKRLVQLHESGLIALSSEDQRKLLTQASDAGDGFASWRLGQRLSSPDSTERNITAAAERFRMGAEQGFHLAAFQLALLHKEGTLGGKPDLRGAIPWMQKAAQLGNPAADLYLGQWYEFGERGSSGEILVPVDVAKARSHYLEAARKGAATGILYLGELYDTAAFGKRDRLAARDYYDKAAAFERDQVTRAKALQRIAQHKREDDLAAASAPIEAARGNPDATVQVIVYSDLDCAACGAFYRDVLRPVVDTFIDRGLIRLLLRGIGTASRKSSLEALMVARCASADRRMRLAERMLEYQGQWALSHEPRQALLTLVEPLLASPADQLAACLDRPEERDRLAAAIAKQDLPALGVGQTPAVFVNGELFEGPNLPDLEFGIIRALPPQSRGPVWHR